MARILGAIDCSLAEKRVLVADVSILTSSGGGGGFSLGGRVGLAD